MNTSDELNNNLFDQRIKNAMDNYEVQPSENVWMALEKQIGKQNFSGGRSGSNAFLIAVAGILSFTGIAAYLYHLKSDTSVVVRKQQPPASFTKISASSQLYLNDVAAEARQSIFITNAKSTRKKSLINFMPLKIVPSLQIKIPSIDLEPKAEVQVVPPVNPSEGRIERKIEKKMESIESRNLDYKDEQHDINNNALYNTEIKDNADLRENSHLNHK